MLKIHLFTGTAWTKTIEVEGTKSDDLLELIDGYYEDNDGLPVPMYNMSELEETYGDDLEMELETMVPINGGEFWIEGISHVEEVLDNN